MQLEAILFDLGGTLLEYTGGYDSWPELEGPGFEAAHIYLSSNGIALPPLVEFKAAGFDILPKRWQMATTGKRNLTVASLLADVLKISEDVLPSDGLMQEAASRYQAAVCAGVVPMPLSYETVEALKKEGYKLGLVSNTMFNGSMHIADMRRFQLDTFFDSMVFSADVNKWKPDPAPFQHVLEDLGILVENALFVGDDPAADVAGGKRTGLYTVHYLSSHRFSSPDGYRPDATIDSLSELLAIVDRLNALSGHDKLSTS